jgi:hypothetical protein
MTWLTDPCLFSTVFLFFQNIAKLSAVGLIAQEMRLTITRIDINACRRLVGLMERLT